MGSAHYLKHTPLHIPSLCSMREKGLVALAVIYHSGFHLGVKDDHSREGVVARDAREEK
jgi:hypothetical protein